MVPAIDVVSVDPGDTATDTGRKASGTDDATGSIPVRAAAPMEIV